MSALDSLAKPAVQAGFASPRGIVPPSDKELEVGLRS
jgi:hypothetical protein